MHTCHGLYGYGPYSYGLCSHGPAVFTDLCRCGRRLPRRRCALVARRARAKLGRYLGRVCDRHGLAATDAAAADEGEQQQRQPDQERQRQEQPAVGPWPMGLRTVAGG